MNTLLNILNRQNPMLNSLSGMVNRLSVMVTPPETTCHPTKHQPASGTAARVTVSPG